MFSKQFGTFQSPNFTVDVTDQGERAGQPIILFRTANYDPAEDLTVAFQGPMADFLAAGLVSTAVDLHYGGGSVAAGRTTRRSRSSTRRSAWTPACASDGHHRYQGEGVTLQPCGVSANTVWIWTARLVAPSSTGGTSR